MIPSECFTNNISLHNNVFCTTSPRERERKRCRHFEFFLPLLSRSLWRTFLHKFRRQQLASMTTVDSMLFVQDPKVRMWALCTNLLVCVLYSNKLATVPAIPSLASWLHTYASDFKKLRFPPSYLMLCFQIR
ncbi:hypothetical protein CDAR_518101 [Caerostris darwini]|uniref:Uncharacterized protein n=1 Tax=Caerostris darwini TaxID=1538125 RepID=A0AAV4VJ44_9ARAC|nr:hypothetical protein CDAR_518101 [Caerostris darwini]